jgi:hypothetical protein
MDPWKESAAWHECRDALRKWAELEGKSAAMREDLYRSGKTPLQPPPHTLVSLGISARLVAWAIEAWRMFRSG